MKIKFTVLLFLLSIQLCLSQKIIENPEHEASALPGKITKMEILKDATILHFQLKLRPGSRIAIPKKSCIIPNDSKTELFVTKAEGIEIGKWYNLDASGEIDYKLYFPPLNKQVDKIDFVESNKGGDWYVNDLIINEAKYSSILPKALKGNWLKTDGSNFWKYGFYNNRAIINKEIWNYTSVKGKKTTFKITLTNGNDTKIIYAKVNKDQTVSFGNAKKTLSKYSLKRTENKNFKLKDDNIYTESTLFTTDSATYKGVLRSFSHRTKQKTGTISIGNIFTGNQDAYIIKIKPDGSFSVKFPLFYPQEVFVELPGYYGAVFVEPGKETWQLINSSNRKDVFFAGDLAEINSGLVNLESVINRKAYYKLVKNIKNSSLKEYKEACTQLYDLQIANYDNVSNTSFLSKKLNQIMRLKLEYGFYEKLLSYDIYNREKKEKEIDSAYLQFLTPQILENKLAVLAQDYSTFINRLRFSEPYNTNKGVRVTHPYGLDLFEILKARGVNTTKEEQAFFDEYIQFNKDNASTLKKEENFNIKNKALLNSYNNKFSQLYTKLSESERKNIFTSKGSNLETILSYAKNLDIVFSDDEIEVQKKRRTIKTKKEKENFKAFYTVDRNKKNNDFTKKYEAEIQSYIKEQLNKQRIENIVSLFDGKKSWMSDLFMMQRVSRPIVDQLTPLSKQELNNILTYINTPFVKEFLKYENNRSLAKIEANKNATDYIINDTPVTEADKIFDAITKKYKGKVIFIDFWATWCGPCIAGMKKMKPMKAELKDKDVVFVYITNPTSPQKTYNNMVPQIKGEHYRVSQDQWNYLKTKFNITGIPHYTLVNKQGKVVKEKIRFSSSASQFKQIIQDQLQSELTEE